MAESGVDLSYDETFLGDGSFKPSPKRQMQSSVSKRYNHNMRYRQKMMLLKQQAEDEELRKLQERKSTAAVVASDGITVNRQRKKSAADAGLSSNPDQASAGRGSPWAIQLSKNAPTTALPRAKYRIVESVPQLSLLGSSLASNASDSLTFVGRAANMAGPVTFTLSSSEPVADAHPFLGFTSDLTDLDTNSQLSATTNTASEVSELQDLAIGCADLEAAEDLDLNEIYPTVVSDFSQLLHASESFASGDLQNEFVWREKKSKTSSSSCPTDYQQQASYKGGRKKDPPPEDMTEEQLQMWEKERHRKDNHNEIEKKRRYKINDHIQELADLLPNNYDIDLQNKKGKILEASVDYIRLLKKDQEQMNRVKEKQAQLERQNRSLRLQLQTLQLSAHLSPPSSQQQQQQPMMQQQQQQQQQHQYEQRRLIRLVGHQHPHQQQQTIEQQEHQQRLAEYILLADQEFPTEIKPDVSCEEDDQQRLAMMPIDEALMNAVYAGMECDDNNQPPPQPTDENPMDINLIDYETHLIGDPFIGEGSLPADFLSLF